ncbi:MAG: aminopeptidase N [Candidatus Contendobacter odensis]|uniref:Aminopeptidase N n=1 Tax=Candidatus Contendibacter odensensis TaxID=1400860 RepID=A0A2G6PEY6_9GAMM|nr:MAG: aminopeptidase N [Candidatus Contendobacter odensis]
MFNKPPKTIYLKDYAPPAYQIPEIKLRFELGEAFTTVHSLLRIVRADTTAADTPLVLDGQQLELLSLELDGVPLVVERYRMDANRLIVHDVPHAFDLAVVTRIRPQDNASLEGLYRSSNNFCTQCEAEGFRKITYFIDRPDVMTVFNVTLIADQARYPVLISNGNLVGHGVLDEGRHWVEWHDPFAKPCYLFALVAGNFKYIEDNFVTRSGRAVTLRIYVEPENIGQCGHAMYSLKQAMAWDETRFGLEYDLDLYQIVAVGDFNMGAMENKGLNIFNTKYVLAKPDIATDSDYQGILAVIGHEYFHNWTGNRVTCRDWFQLSLKEGLTVFRDQEFSADLGSRGTHRIETVRMLRSSQFPQDAGPMAHPVRPESYIEVNNFYTVTVYNKGAEVVRMIQTLLGQEGFRRGMDWYFQRHDGHAVTCEDFIAAMADANAVNLNQFKRWYHQAGTPELAAHGDYDPATCIYTLTVRQWCPPTPNQEHKKAFHIPLALGLLDADGHDLPLQLQGESAARGTTRVLELREPEHIFHFVNIPHDPVPSLLRGFSAPVKLHTAESEGNLRFRLAHDSDDFNRWDAGQRLAVQVILALIEDRRCHRAWALPDTFSAAFKQALESDADPALLAQLLMLPGEIYLAEQMDVVDVDGIHAARTFVRRSLAERLREPLLAIYQRLQHAQEQESYQIDATAIGQRALKNVCLDYLMQLEDNALRQLCLKQFRTAGNMTDQLGALTPLVDCDCAERMDVLAEFYGRWQHEALVVDKWFTLQATSRLPDTLATVKQLMQHKAFNRKNPNKIRALIGAFCQANPIHFHALDGSGYNFLGDQIAILNAFNPQIAARLMNAFTRWHKYDRVRQASMREQLQRILALPGLSPDVYEVAAKSLG